MTKPYGYGFSILEMMIAVSLGALLVASVGAVYVSNKTTYNIQQAFARLQENARFAAYSMSRDLRMAGYTGCANINNMVISNITGNTLFDFDQPIQGYEGGSSSFSPSLPSNLSGIPIANSDVIVVRKGSSFSVQVRQTMTQTDNPLPVYDRITIEPGDSVLVTNCSIGDVFIAGNNTNATAITHPTSVNVTDSLSIAYTEEANVMLFEYFAYLVTDTGRVNENNEPINALVRIDDNGNRVEIAEGVDQMQIIYGVDTNSDNDADTFMTASEVETSNNWDNVLNTQIRLLMTTPENVSDKPINYTFNNQAVSPTDRKMRREVDVFVTFRNRGMPG